MNNVRTIIKASAYLFFVAWYAYITFFLVGLEYTATYMFSIVVSAFCYIGYLIYRYLAGKKEIRQANISTGLTETHRFKHNTNAFYADLYLFSSYILLIACYMLNTKALCGPISSGIFILAPACYCMAYFIKKHLAVKREIRQGNTSASLSESHGFTHRTNSICAYLYLIGGYIFLILNFFIEDRKAEGEFYLLWILVCKLPEYLIYVVVNHTLTNRIIARKVVIIVEVLLFITLVAIFFSDIHYENMWFHNRTTCELYFIR